MGMMIQCPEQFRQRYLLKTEDKMFSQRFSGIVNHRVHEEILRLRMAGETYPDLNRLYAETWNGAIDEGDEPDWRDDDPVKVFDSGMKMVLAYEREVAPDLHPVAVEERIEFTIPGLPAKVIGYVDMFEAGRIRERKTAAVKTTKPKPKWRFQGLIYQYATGLPVQWDVVTRQVEPKVYTAKDWPDLYLSIHDPKFIRQMILDTARRMNDLYAQYGRDNPWPMTGIFGDWLCDYCPIGPKYGRSCPAWTTTI